MSLESELKQETLKWLERMEKKRKKVKLLDKTKKDLIKNIDAYISDSRFFLQKGDLIRAFEAVTWSWSWLTILEELKIVETKA